MADVRGCHLPDDLLYDVENHIWFKEQDDGNVKLGMTTVATAVANQRQTDRSFYMALSFCVPICWTAVTMPLMRTVPGDPLLKRRLCQAALIVMMPSPGRCDIDAPLRASMGQARPIESG